MNIRRGFFPSPVEMGARRPRLGVATLISSSDWPCPSVFAVSFDDDYSADFLLIIDHVWMAGLRVR
jgi:hypothetical protein